MGLTKKYTEIVGITHVEGEEQCHDLFPRITQLERTIERVWAILQKRSPFIGGYLPDAVERVLSRLEEDCDT